LLRPGNLKIFRLASGIQKQGTVIKLIPFAFVNYKCVDYWLYKATGETVNAEVTYLYSRAQIKILFLHLFVKSAGWKVITSANPSGMGQHSHHQSRGAGFPKVK